MTLTTEQQEFIKAAIILFVFNVGALYILKKVFRKIKKMFRTIKIWFIKQRNKRKGKKGYRNYKGDTWYPDGTIWNAEKGKWEEADYKNNK